MNQDERIRDDIQEEIAWDPRVKTTDIGVTVKNGAVRLTGAVSSYAERYAAESAARRVKGVHAVAEDIEIKLPFDDTVTDEKLAERISNLLEWNVIVPDADVRAEVRGGHVSLTGEVDWNFERESLNNQIVHMRGVKSVKNQIAVRKKAPKEDVSTRELKYQITRALHRNADLEKSNISVAVDGGKVTLTGSIKANYEKEMIENAVWSAPGVTQVVDQLRIG